MPRCLTVAGFFAQLRPRALYAEQLQPPSRAVPQLLVAGGLQFDRDVRGGAHYPRGSVGAWLFSVSISRMNFSASMGVASLILSRRRAITAPDGAIRGPYACLPQIGGSSADEVITT